MYDEPAVDDQAAVAGRNSGTARGSWPGCCPSITVVSSWSA